MSELLLDRAGRRRSPATMPGFHAGRPPHNKGLRYPADPPKVEEIAAVMRTASLKPISITDAARYSCVAARADVAREVGMDAWAWDELQPWLELCRTPRRSAVLCPQRPDAWSPVVDRRRSSRVAAQGGHSGGPPTIRRQLGHSNLGITSVYLQ